MESVDARTDRVKAIDPIDYSLTTNGSIYWYRAYRSSGWTSISPSSISAINSSIPTSSSRPSSSQTSITSNRWLVLYLLIKTPSYIPINETFQAFFHFVEAPVGVYPVPIPCSPKHEAQRRGILEREQPSFMSWLCSCLYSFPCRWCPYLLLSCCFLYCWFNYEWCSNGKVNGRWLAIWVDKCHY